MKHNPFSPERWPNELAKAYRAFGVYRDLGPNRSLNRAWKQFCAEQGKDSGSARRPGQWTRWSRKYHWVERARAYDDLMEEERRTADAVRRQNLQEQRSLFAVEDQQRKQDLVRKAHLVTMAALEAPRTGITQVKTDKVNGIKTTTAIKPSSFRDIAALIDTSDRIANRAIQGIDSKNPYKEDRQVERVVWVQNDEHPNADKDPNLDVDDHPGSISPQPFAELDSSNQDAEEDKAA